MLKKTFFSDKFIIVLILLNTVTVFIQGFEDFPEGVLKTAFIIDYTLTLFFVIEIIVKLKVLRLKPFWADYWNRADLTLVVLSLPSLLLAFADVKGNDLSILMVLRITRIFKFLRFLRFVPGIEHLIAGVRRASKASFVVLISFFVFIVICAVLSSYLFNDISSEHFGNPLRGMYSIFRLFTIEGWYEIPDALIKDQGGIAVFVIRMYFIGLLVIGGIFGLSIVNSIFVDAMVADNTDHIEEKIDLLYKEITSLRKELTLAKGVPAKEKNKKK